MTHFNPLLSDSGFNLTMAVQTIGPKTFLIHLPKITQEKCHLYLTRPCNALLQKAVDCVLEAIQFTNS